MNSKTQSTISLLIHGGNVLGESLAKTLIEQGGQVIIVDNFNKETKRVISNLRSKGKADFIDFHGFESLLKTIGRIDYVFYLLSEKISFDNELNSKDFLEESSNLSMTLKMVTKFDAKFSLVSSIDQNRAQNEEMNNSSMTKISPYSAHELQRYCETLVAEMHDKSKANARILRIGNYLGNGVESINDPVVNELVKDAITKTQIKIEGEGLEQHFLIDISDLVFGLLKLTFDSSTEGEVISLTNNHEYSTLSIAYKLLEINPEIRDIKFVSGSTKQLYTTTYTSATNADQFGWQQKVTLEESLINTVKNFNPNFDPKRTRGSKDVKVETVTKTYVKTPIGRFIDSVLSPFKKVGTKVAETSGDLREKLSISDWIKLGIGTLAIVLFFFFILSPIISIGIGSYQVYSNTKKAIQSAQILKLDLTEKYFERASSGVVKTGKGLGQIKWLFAVTGQSNLYDNTSQLIFGATYALSGAQDVSRAVLPLQSYLTSFQPSLTFQNDLPTSHREYSAELTELKANSSLLKKGIYNLELSSNLIESVDIAVFPKPIQDKLIEMKSLNTQAITQLDPLKNIVTFLPDLLGIKERMTYLVLLQNPQEIRSTGGWLSSYALVGIEGGQLRELKVDDVYNVDGKLKTDNIKILAPSSMRSALDIDNYTFSLSNWNPDLKEVYSTTQYILSRTDPGRQIDGVITIDTEFFKKLLTVWGEIRIPGEQTSITAANLDDKLIELHKGFVPGQSVKSAFLANLANTMLQKVFTVQTDKYMDIGNVIITSLNEKHMQIYVSNKDAYDYLDSMNWSGTLSPKFQAAPFIIEWNWGANKANKYVERAFDLNVDIVSEKEIQYTYKVSERNNSTAKIYPQGDYINYARVYIPINSKVSSVKGFTNGKFTTSLENGYKVISGWFNTTVQSTRNLEIKYTLKTSDTDIYKPIVKENNSIKYDLAIFKQPGTLSDPLSITITYPDTWTVSSSEGFERFLNQLSSQTKLDTTFDKSILWKIKN